MYLILEVKPAGSLQLVAVTEERLLDGVGVGGPAALHVAQHGLEVLPVVAHRVVLVLKGWNEQFARKIFSKNRTIFVKYVPYNLFDAVCVHIERYSIKKSMVGN